MPDQHRERGRPEMDDDATGNLRPEDETQETAQGTKIGLLRKDEIMADFKKIAEGEKD